MGPPWLVDKVGREAHTLPRFCRQTDGQAVPTAKGGAEAVMYKLVQPSRDVGGPWGTARRARRPRLWVPFHSCLCLPLPFEGDTMHVAIESNHGDHKAPEPLQRWARSPWPARCRTAETGKAWSQEDRGASYFPFRPGLKFLPEHTGTVSEARTSQGLRPADPPMAPPMQSARPGRRRLAVGMVLDWPP